MAFHVWLTTAWTNLLSWFGVEQQKLASFLYPVFNNTKALIKKDFLTDVIALIPAVETALTGGYAAALAEAEALLAPLLAKQGAELSQTDLAIIQNGLVAQAQASVAASQTVTNGPLPAVAGSAAEIVAAATLAATPAA